MPRVTQEAFERAEKILDEKIEGHGYHCSICGGVRCTLHPNIFSIPDIPPGGRRRKHWGWKGIPGISTVKPLTGSEESVMYMDLMFITCDNCGHVDFFNAHQLKVFEEEE